MFFWWFSLLSIPKSFHSLEARKQRSSKESLDDHDQKRRMRKRNSLVSNFHWFLSWCFSFKISLVSSFVFGRMTDEHESPIKRLVKTKSSIILLFSQNEQLMTLWVTWYLKGIITFVSRDETFFVMQKVLKFLVSSFSFSPKMKNLHWSSRFVHYFCFWRNLKKFYRTSRTRTKYRVTQQKNNSSLTRETKTQW